jgi:hypothetical protein
MFFLVSGINHCHSKAIIYSLVDTLIHGLTQSRAVKQIIIVIQITLVVIQVTVAIQIVKNNRNHYSKEYKLQITA